MAFCKNCGADIGDSNFCPKCGTAADADKALKSETIKSGTVNVKRPKSANGAINPISISINGREVQTLKNGAECSIPLPYGIYNMEVSAPLNKTISASILLDDQHTNSNWTTKFGMNGLTLENNNPLSGAGVIDNKKKKSKRGGCLTAVVLLLGLFVIIAVIGGNSSSKSGTSKTETKTTTSKNDKETSTSEIKTTETKELAFSERTENLTNWEITISDFEYTDNITVGLLTGYKPEDGCQYCVISMTVKNTGKEADCFLPLLTYGDKTAATLDWNGYSFTKSELLLTGESLTNATINPLVSNSGKIVFEVPNEVVDSDIAPVLVISAGDAKLTCELIKK